MLFALTLLTLATETPGADCGSCGPCVPCIGNMDVEECAPCEACMACVPLLEAALGEECAPCLECIPCIGNEACTRYEEEACRGRIHIYEEKAKCEVCAKCEACMPALCVAAGCEQCVEQCVERWIVGNDDPACVEQCSYCEPCVMHIPAAAEAYMEACSACIPCIPCIGSEDAASTGVYGGVRTSDRQAYMEACVPCAECGACVPALATALGEECAPCLECIPCIDSEACVQHGAVLDGFRGDGTTRCFRGSADCAVCRPCEACLPALCDVAGCGEGDEGADAAHCAPCADLRNPGGHSRAHTQRYYPTSQPSDSSDTVAGVFGLLVIAALQ